MKRYMILVSISTYNNEEDAAKRQKAVQENLSGVFGPIVKEYDTRSEAEADFAALPEHYIYEASGAWYRRDYRLDEAVYPVDFQFEADADGNVLWARNAKARFKAVVVIPEDKSVSEDYGYLTAKKALIEKMTASELDGVSFPYDGQEEHLSADASDGTAVVNISRIFDQDDLFESVFL